MKKKVIVITGGTRGIGKYLAHQFLKKGHMVYIIYRSLENLALVKNEFVKYQNQVFFIQADLSKEKEIKKAFNEIKRLSHFIDILINNAACDQMSDIEHYDYGDFDKIIKTNLLGKVFCIKYAIQLLKKSPYPVIINIASRLATKPMLDSSAYCCAASAIVMLTKCAALELEKYSIRVNCISPSLTLTDLAKKSYSNDIILLTSKQSTRDRLCTTHDIYELIQFLISDKSDYINGENINLNGGLLLK